MYCYIRPHNHAGNPAGNNTDTGRELRTIDIRTFPASRYYFHNSYNLVDIDGPSDPGYIPVDILN